MNENEKIRNQSSRLLLGWIAIWGKSKIDKKDGTYLGTTDYSLQFAAYLLAKFGVLKQNPDSKKYIYISSKINLPKDYDFEEIICGFYYLGDFYGYGVLFLEEGFKVADNFNQLFDNLVKLGYCSTHDGFYFWTEKTSKLSSDYFGFPLKRRKSVYGQYLECLLGDRKIQSGSDILTAIYLRKRIGLNKDAKPLEVTTALMDWMNKWESNPIVWPSSEIE